MAAADGLAPTMTTRYGETPGADFVQVKPPAKCKRCGGELTVALVQYPGAVYKWRNFARQPVERDGRRFYLRHACPR